MKGSPLTVDYLEGRLQLICRIRELLVFPVKLIDKNKESSTNILLLHVNFPAVVLVNTNDLSTINPTCGPTRPHSGASPGFAG